MSRPHHLDVEKAVQAAGVLLRREAKQMSRLRLVKLLYIADRKSWQQFGAPIIGPRYLAVPHGPLHALVHDLVNGAGPDLAAWSSHFQNLGRNIRIDSEPPTDDLSRVETALLNQVADELSHADDWEVAELTRTFPEWLKNQPLAGERWRFIPLEDVIDAVGRGADRESILQDLRDRDAYDSFFSSLSARAPT